MTEEGKKPPYKRHPVAIALVLAVMFIGSGYGVLYTFDYVPNILPILLDPVVGVSVAVIFVLIGVVGGFIAIRRRGSLFGGGERADQLTKREADRLATRWHRNRGILAMNKGGNPVDGIDYVESGSTDEDENARIYEKVIVPKKDDNKKCILINLEQSVSVDLDDRSSMDRAINEMNDSIFFSEEGVKDFYEAREKYKNNLAGGSSGKTEIVEHRDGSRTIRNVKERNISSPDTQNHSESKEVEQT